MDCQMVLERLPVGVSLPLFELLFVFWNLCPFHRRTAGCYAAQPYEVELESKADASKGLLQHGASFSGVQAEKISSRTLPFSYISSCDMCEGPIHPSEPPLGSPLPFDYLPLPSLLQPLVYRFFPGGGSVLTMAPPPCASPSCPSTSPSPLRLSP